MSNEAGLHKKRMFEITEKLLESGHMPWALRDQVEEEDVGHQLAEVGEEKQAPPIHAVCSLSLCAQALRV